MATLTPQFFRTKSALWLALPVGAALALAFAPFGWWPLAIVGPTYLFACWDGAAPRRAAQVGFLFTAGLYLAGTYWLYHSVHTIGHAPVWVALLLMLGLVSIMGVYTALLGYLLARWLPAGIEVRTFSYLASPAVRYLLLLPAAWTALEWFRGWFMSGFPWLALGYTQTDTPLAAYAPLGGVYAISLCAAMSAGALVILVRGTTHERLAAAALVALIWIPASLLSNRSWTQPQGAPMTVAIVQGAVPQEVKWNREYRDSTVQLYYRLTVDHFGKDIIVWPEAALPIVAHEAEQFLRGLSAQAAAKGSRIVTGLLRRDPGRDAYYNGVLALDRQPQWYYKRRLVPFGEFFPVPQFIRRRMRLMNLPTSDLTAGQREQPALLIKGRKLGATICYEDAYGAEQLAVLKEATFLINVTNDAWFGDSTAAPQHLQISRMRAMEAGRPILRAANDGISALIAADGAVEKVLRRFQPGVLTGTIQPRSGLTPYARAGNWPTIVLCGLIIAVAIASRLSVRRRKN